MKTNAKKTLNKLFVSLLLMLVMLPLSGRNAEAKVWKQSYKSKYYLTTKSADRYVTWIGMSEEMEIGLHARKFTVSSSNKKVCEISRKKKNQYRFYWKKPGKVTITFKYYNKKGKLVARVKQNYTVMKSPLESVVSNGRNVTSEIRDDQSHEFRSGAFSVKLKSGWSIDSALLEYDEIVTESTVLTEQDSQNPKYNADGKRVVERTRQLSHTNTAITDTVPDESRLTLKVRKGSQTAAFEIAFY